MMHYQVHVWYDLFEIKVILLFFLITYDQGGLQVHPLILSMSFLAQLSLFSEPVRL